MMGNNVALVPRGVHSSAPKSVINLGDGIDLSYNLNTSMNTDGTTWAADNATVTYGRSFSYDGLPADTETVITFNYPFVSVFYQMKYMPAWLSKWQALAQMSYKMYNQNF
jgi:hypothetical protein